MTIDTFVDRVNSNIPTEGVKVIGDFSVFGKAGFPYYLLRAAEEVTPAAFYDGKQSAKYLSKENISLAQQTGLKRNWNSIKGFYSKGEYRSVQVQTPTNDVKYIKSKTSKGQGISQPLISLGGVSTKTINVDGVKGIIDSDSEILDGAEILIPFEAFQIEEYSDVNISNISIDVAKYLMENNVSVELSGAKVIGAWKGSDISNVWTDYFILGKETPVGNDQTFQDLKEISLLDTKQAQIKSLTQDSKITEVIDSYDSDYIGTSVTDNYALVQSGRGMNESTLLVQIGSPEVKKSSTSEPSNENQNQSKNTKAILIGLAVIGVAVVGYFIYRNRK